MSIFTERRARSDERMAEHELRESVKWAFRQSCIGAGVALAVDAPVAGTGWRTPHVQEVRLGPPLRLSVRMCEGQVPAQLSPAG